jgi:hypothetical protein
MFDDQFSDDAAPASDFVPPPAWPKVLGIVSIALGGLGFVCGGLGLLITPLMSGLIGGQLNGAPMPAAYRVGPVDIAIGVTGLALSGLLVFAGILLVSRSPTARLLHLIYAIPAIPLNIAAYLVQAEKQASLKQWAADYPDNVIAQGINQGGPGQAVGEICGLSLFVALGLLFPLFIFVWFFAIKVRPEQITGTQDGVI